MSKIMYDIMIDLETWSELPIAAIASIGAVKFNIKTREIVDEFYCTIDPNSCKAHNLHFSKDTIEWWKKQSKEARDALKINNIDLTDALLNLKQWMDPYKNLCSWGIFDIPILHHAYYKIGQKEPWKFYDVLECRSISKMFDGSIDRTSATHHNALVDARIQAQYMIDIINPKEPLTDANT